MNESVKYQDDNQVTVSMRTSEFDFDSAAMLSEYGISYSDAGLYLHCGEVEAKFGWMLHLTATKVNIVHLLKVVIPELVESKIPFRIIKNSDLATRQQDGAFGFTEIGKLISIFPRNEMEAVDVAEKLKKLTKLFYGPVVPGAVALSEIVFVNFGAYDPFEEITDTGEIKRVFIDFDGSKRADFTEFPNVVPVDMKWPFGEQLTPKGTTTALLNGKYKIDSVIKPDAKGFVFKGKYRKGYWQEKDCIIKQGRRHMYADYYGRDVKDHLEWQYILHKDLWKRKFPVPEVYDFFSEFEDHYLAMEFINGRTLEQEIGIIYNGGSWTDLNRNSKLLLLDHMIKVADLIQLLHSYGYIHRDISPANFMLDDRKKWWLIDIEMVWSVERDYPDPPFNLGTPGFCSPAQLSQEIPSKADDVYSLGALMLVLFTNTLPIKYNFFYSSDARKCINNLIQNSDVAGLIIACLNYDPDLRPGIGKVINELQRILKLISGPLHSESPAPYQLKSDDLAKIIEEGIRGIVNDRFVDDKLVWLSKQQNASSKVINDNIFLSERNGFFAGAAGILYMLSHAKITGFDISACHTYIDAAIKRISDYRAEESIWNGGLFDGTAGVSISIYQCLRSGITTAELTGFDNIVAELYAQNEQINLAYGYSGQAFAIASVYDSLKDERRADLKSICMRLVALQREDGAWDLAAGGNRNENILTGFSYGVAGVCFALLKCLQIEHDEQVFSSVKRATAWLLSHAGKMNNTFYWHSSVQSQEVDPWGFGNGIPGIVFTLLEAYKTLKDDRFLAVATTVLKDYPNMPIIPNYTLNSGLAGIGCVYIRAYQVTTDNYWLNKAGNIVKVITNSFYRAESDSVYWMADHTRVATADLWVGTSGILLFLIKYFNEIQNK